jgi:hypothetical protein
MLIRCRRRVAKNGRPSGVRTPPPPHPPAPPHALAPPTIAPVSLRALIGMLSCAAGQDNRSYPAVPPLPLEPGRLRAGLYSNRTSVPIPPPATTGSIIKSLAYWVGLTGLFAYFAFVSFRRHSYISFTVWAIAATWWGVYLPWINRGALRALATGKPSRFRTDASGRVTMKCPSCGSEAVVDLAAESVTCRACGMNGKVQV